METLAPRILSDNRKVRGHVEKEFYKKAFDFFCDKFKKESSADAADDTKEEFGIDVRVVKQPCEQLNDRLVKVYDVYIGKKEHS